MHKKTIFTLSGIIFLFVFIGVSNNMLSKQIESIKEDPFFAPQKKAIDNNDNNRKRKASKRIGLPHIDPKNDPLAPRKIRVPEESSERKTDVSVKPQYEISDPHVNPGALLR